jgi:hypothetical protein
MISKGRAISDGINKKGRMAMKNGHPSTVTTGFPV